VIAREIVEDLTAALAEFEPSPPHWRPPVLAGEDLGGN
jgi:hypothetical protein